MINEIIKKISNNILLNEEEILELLSWACQLIREDSDILDPMDSNCKVCYKTAEKFGRLMLMRFGFDVEILDIKKLLQIPLTHYANIISFNINGNVKTYLVDMTYSQFFGKTITLDDNTVICTEEIFKEQEEEFLTLRKQGFIELNKDIFKKYINNFLDICHIKEKNNLYKNIEDKIFNNNIEKIKKYSK